MKKRTKLEMKWMNEDVTEWLLKSDNNPHVAWDEYCKHLVMNNHLRSHYIKGKEDFVKVSKELETELKQQQEIKQQKQIIKQNKEKIISELKTLTPKQAKTLWSQHRGNLQGIEKVLLMEIVSIIIDDNWTWSDLTDQHIKLYSKLNLQPA
jgi:hypothetical protein